MDARRRLAWSLGFVFASSWGAWLAAAGEAPGRDYGSGSIHRSFEWQEAADARRAAGLYLMDYVPSGMVSRVLAEDPAGRQVRITVSVDPRRGLETSELLDDASGWRARLDLDFGLRADTLGAFFAADEARSAARQRVLYRMRLKANGMRPVDVETELELAEREALHAAVVEAVSKTGAGRELGAHMPEHLAEAILFLEASMSPDPLQAHTAGDNFLHGLRGIVEVLAGVLRTTPPAELSVTHDATPWRMAVGPIERGTSTSDPKVLEFVSRFRSVQNADPLSDRSAAEVFAAPRPPT